MRMRLGKDDLQDVTIASVSSTIEESDSYVVICLCPKCGEFIDEYVEKCPKCTSYLTDRTVAEKSVSSDVLESRSSFFLCSDCGNFTSVEFTHCNTCGALRPPTPTRIGNAVSSSPSDKTIIGYTDSLLETKPSLYICTECGAFLSPRASKCGICGTEASENATAESVQETVVIDIRSGEFFSDMLSNQGELSICGQCGAFMSLESDSCSMCGVEKTVMLVCEEIEVESEENENSSSSSLLMCDECGAFVSSDAKFCTSCGIEMSTEEPYVEESLEVVEAESLVETHDNLVILEKMNTKAKEHINETETVLVSLESKEDKPEVYRKWWKKKARALIKLGRYTEAMESLNHALELKPDDIDLITEKAHLYYIINHYEEAAELYKKVLEVQPRNILLWNKLGNALFRLNHIKESQICYEKALSLDSNISETIINQGYLYLKQRKYDEALGYARRMVA